MLRRELLPRERLLLAAVLAVPLLWEVAATLGRTPRSWPLTACSAGIAAAVFVGGWSARKLLPAGLVAAALLLVSAALPLLCGGTTPPLGASPQTPSLYGYAGDYPRLMDLPIAQLTAVLAVVVLLFRSAPVTQVAAGVGALTTAAASAAVLDWVMAHRAHAATAIAPATLWGYGVLALGTATAIGLYARQPSAASYSVASR
ncbi:hypothetical protein [Amycolatopsis pigmentata]|uniref:MYXO-CTERM domain-containing protein n=1 Tax=Amycolatopsis pigmentata TaxID=450801 RepID=A0ABW5FVB8_9PSEU